MVQAGPPSLSLGPRRAVVLPGGMRREGGLAGRAAGAPRWRSRSGPAPGTPAGHGQRPAAPGPAFSGNMTAGCGEPGKGGGRGCPAGREGATWRRSLREWQQSYQQRGWRAGRLRQPRRWQPRAVRQPCEPAPHGNSRARPPLRWQPTAHRVIFDRPEQDKTWIGEARLIYSRFESCVLGCRWVKRLPSLRRNISRDAAAGGGERGRAAPPPAEQPRPCPELAALLPHGHAPSHSPRPASPPTRGAGRHLGPQDWRWDFHPPSCNSALHPLQKLLCLFQSKPLYLDSGDVRLSPARLSSCCHTVP